MSSQNVLVKYKIVNMEEYFLWYKAIHVIAVISWMAAMFYLPRLFVYHSRPNITPEMDKTFKLMERSRVPKQILWLEPMVFVVLCEIC